MNEPISIEAALQAVDAIANGSPGWNQQTSIIRGALQAAKRLHEILNHRPSPEAPTRIERMEKLAQEATTALEKQVAVNLSVAGRMEGLREQLLADGVVLAEALRLLNTWTRCKSVDDLRQQTVDFVETHKDRR